ncbi:regulatory-associated protein of mTOR-like isoform X1 [Octopus vulgaris]|uniref:Regulatory-associated protein of mTOR-like isoform X1 n=2 Tax=Octopus TaxID=6643 RepID=A0AA36FJL9_OCTVU|nr:regulatory-associated protein of mTOR isoform X2 [Octopus sinensis]CAI9740062.1 regulatory-associated protein of mTOR-like isoform X1 [Octopus vulgaris]
MTTTSSSNSVNDDSRSCCSSKVYEDEKEETPDSDRRLPLAFNLSRHTEKILAPEVLTQTWRMKERMKTVSVALVLCLNVGVDPPDVVKTSPCARLECWVDPLSMSPPKALETIGNRLHQQYDRWQPRARYKQSLDPTGDEVKKLCTTMRRNAKDERVLFHYNGHGVPKPTSNGEIWVFNKTYTQYIPLSIYDLQSWMGSPSIYVYDCSNAGVIVESFKQFSAQREQEREAMMSTHNSSVTGEISSGSSVSSTTNPTAASTPVSMSNCIQLAACSKDELLPMNPELPADVFTSCLTTPIKMALTWYVSQDSGKLVSGATQELVDKIPGQLNDRRTMLGELNWIFTAITDTIAWNTLPRELFQKLFRQDLLVASLFRNFLLAERIMRSYNCTPVSSPPLPPTYQHRMWAAWDFALDMCLRQLSKIVDSDGTQFDHSTFFAQQLTAFQVWLTYGSETRNPPEQLPIVLQVLLSQVHRVRALELLGRFLDLGPWAVSLALSVGIFPYVLKLLQSSARDLRPLLVFIWSKILAVDSSCQTELVKDNGHNYFLSVLSDQCMSSEHRTMAAFILATIVNNYPQGQKATFQGNVISICLEQLHDSNPHFRQWLALCLGKVWMNYESARWCGVRDLAHEKLSNLLTDSVPEVRAAAVYALGTYISCCSSARSDHASNIDLGIGMSLTHIIHDGSSLVRKELAVALGGLVQQFESPFVAVASQMLGEERLREKNTPMIAAVTPGGWNVVTPVSSDGYLTLPLAGMKRSASRGNLKSATSRHGLSSSNSISNLEGLIMPDSGGGATASGSGTLCVANSDRIRRTSSSSNLSTCTSMVNNVYVSVWRTLLLLSSDPHPEVMEIAKIVINDIKQKSAPSSPPGRGSNFAAMRNHSADVPDSKSDMKVDQNNEKRPRSQNSESSTEGRREITSPNKKSSSSSQTKDSGLNKGANMANVMTSSQELRRQQQGTLSAGSTTHRRDNSGERNRRSPSHSDTNGTESDSAKSSKRGSRNRPASPANQLIPYSAQFLPTRKMFDKGPGHVDDKKDEPGNKEFKEPLVTTQFFKWSSKYFAQPLKPGDEGDPESKLSMERDYRFQRNATVRNEAKVEQFKAGHNRFDDQIFVNKNSGSPAVLRFHPYEAHLAVADKDNISIWDWEQGIQLSHVNSCHPKNCRITSMEFINPHDQALLMCGSDDGSIRVWRHYSEQGKQELVTAFQGLSEMLPLHRGSGLVVSWDQNTETLFTTGDARIIRIWDIHREMKTQDLLTGADSCVTSITSDPSNMAVLVAGCGDGSVRVFDSRLSPSESLVRTFQEHTSWVMNVHYQRGLLNKIVSSSSAGDIRFWDIRHPESVRKFQLQQGLTAIELHQYADVIASGSNQAIVIFNHAGEQRSVIKNHEGFLGQRIGPVRCLTFHPYKVKLAAGCTDSLVSVYSTAQ